MEIFVGLVRDIHVFSELAVTSEVDESEMRETKRLFFWHKTRITHTLTFKFLLIDSMYLWLYTSSRISPSIDSNIQIYRKKKPPTKIPITQTKKKLGSK